MERFEQLKITNVKRNRGFLEIYGHKRPILLDQLESRIVAFQPDIRKKSEIQLPSIEFDTTYLAVSEGSKKYHRCVVVEKKFHNKVVIDLIDFGLEFEVDPRCLLELSENDEMSKFLRELPPIANKYFLCSFYCTWRNNEFAVIEQLVKNTQLMILNEQMDREHHYISLEFCGRDLTDKLTADSIGIAISFTEQRIEVRKLFQRAIDVDEQVYQCRSPVKRSPARRNLVPNRPLQSVINNNVIADHRKRLIEGHIGMNTHPQQHRSPRSEISQIDGGASSSVSANQMPAFIANDLPTGPYHIVYCSYVEDGPSLFSVQLKNHEHILNKMTFDLVNAPRNPITTKMMIGMACLAQYSEDNSLYRAVIQKVQANGCLVTFIDFGNSEFVPFANIFEIPQKFLDHKIFSIPFQLAGIKELQPIDERLNEYFKEITKSELELKVVPSDNPQIQQCELFIEAKSVLDMLLTKQKQSNTFSPPPGLKDGENVIIRGAITAKEFYLQRCVALAGFDKMMDALFNSCAVIAPMKKMPAVGKCCAFMYKDNPEFFRAIVTKEKDDRSVSVRLVDYGVDLSCGVNQLREMDPSFFELPQQAIECCLVDFENVADVSTATGEQISMLIGDKEGKPNQFRVSVRRRMDNGVYLVDLRDEVNGVNVSSSIYKHAMPRKFQSTRKDPEKSSNDKNVQQNIVRTQEKPLEPVMDNNNNRRNGNANQFDNEKTNEKQTEPLYTEPIRADPASNAVVNELPLVDAQQCASPASTSVVNEVQLIDVQSASPASTPVVNGVPLIDVQQSASETNASDKLGTMGYITHVDHPNQFYLQLDSDTEQILKLEQSLQIIAAQLSPLPTGSFRRGNLCIAKYTYDNQWYRAKIIDSDGEITSIKFIDYGNTDTITDNSLLKSCDAIEQFNLKPLALLCSLPVEPSASAVEWSSDACQKIRDLINTPVKFEVIGKNKELSYVKLSVGGRDIVKDLIFGGLAEQLEIINSGEICYISHINSLDDFFIQVNSDGETLNLIEDHLSAANGFPPVDEPTKGTICAALFPDDSSYYRAQIIDETPTNGIKVVFLDYGNCETLRAHELRTLSPDLIGIPHLRKRCCLQLPDNVQCWNEEAARKFSDLGAGGATAFTVKLIKPGKRAMVELFIGNENVAQMLGHLCEQKQLIDTIVDDHEHPPQKTPPAEKSLNLDGFTSGRHEGFISHIDSVNKLFIQLASKSDDLDIMAANLQMAHDFEKVPIEQANIGSIVAALFSDQTYYRAKIVDKNENGAVVYFIDYGNEWVSSDLRKLPDVLQSIEPLAVMVKLGAVVQQNFNETDHEQFLNLSQSDADTSFQIEFEDATSETPIVHIWQDGRAIIDYLRCPRPTNQTPNPYTAAVDQMIEAAAK